MRGDYETAPAGKGEWKVQQHGGRRAVKMHGIAEKPRRGNP